MNCSDVNERTIDFLYDELDKSSRREFEQHVAGCENCRRELEGLGATLGQARAMLSETAEAPPPSFQTAKAEMVRSAELVNSRGLRLRTVGAPVIPEDAGGFWSLLRKPWLVPALAAASVISLFFIAREVLTPRGAVAPAESEPPPSLVGERASAPPAAAPLFNAPAPSDEGPAKVAADEVRAAQPAARKRRRNAPFDDRLSAARERDDDFARSRAQAKPSARPPLPEEEDDGEEGGIEGGVAGVKADLAAAPTPAAPAAPAAGSVAAKPPVRIVGQLRPPTVATGAPAWSPPAEYGRAQALAGAEGASASLAARDKRVYDLADRAEAEARHRADAQVASQRELIDLGGRLFTEGRMADAAVVYQNLIERYPTHDLLPLWKNRLARARRTAGATPAPAPTAAGISAPAAPATRPTAAPTRRPAAAAKAKALPTN